MEVVELVTLSRSDPSTIVAVAFRVIIVYLTGASYGVLHHTKPIFIFPFAHRFLSRDAPTSLFIRDSPL